MRIMTDLLLQANDAGEFALGLGLAALVLVLIAIVVLILAVMVVVQAYQAGRRGWWIYLIALFIGPLNIIAIILWFAHFKKNPVIVDGKPFL